MQLGNKRCYPDASLKPHFSEGLKENTEESCFRDVSTSYINWVLDALLTLVAGIVVASFLLIKFFLFAILALYGLVGIVLFLVLGPEHLAAVIVGTIFIGTIILFALKAIFFDASETVIPREFIKLPSTKNRFKYLIIKECVVEETTSTFILLLNKGKE